ncbi:FAD-binding oxidoreductase [Kutzneria sp. 744]|uniref:NAD(P)/FAD-dependent oxidoreductase n=1 Tax=Kutzneria sp. (strain 744) TaxID=345341 RepID=UPI0003EEB59D|nr:FAD-binding oxidoreductase [Kutzneria sp. 744]EWM19318.1 LigA protein [Kutzneria sp. 744]
MSSIVVVGAGVTGMVTAIECARVGHRVTLLDRGPIPNPASTSADQHRALRVLRPGDPVMTAQFASARTCWLELESLLGERFFRQVGIVTAWPRNEVGALTVVEPEKLPHIRFPHDTVGVLDADAGVLLADRFLDAAARWLSRRPNVTVRPECSVKFVAEHWVSLVDGTALGADVVVVAAGPWSRELVDIPVKLYRQTMVYLRPPADLAAWWEHAPGAGGLGADCRAWLLPPGDGTLLKISSDLVCRDVDSTAGGEPGPWVDRLLAEPILSEMDRYQVVAVRECHYATDPGTGGPLLHHFGPGLWVRPACGGSGFAAAPLVARTIVEAMEATA